jgi:hypothetical protein
MQQLGAWPHSPRSLSHTHHGFLHAACHWQQHQRSDRRGLPLLPTGGQGLGPHLGGGARQQLGTPPSCLQRHLTYLQPQEKWNHCTSYTKDAMCVAHR